MKRYLLTSAALGLLASIVACGVLLTTDQPYVRLIAMIIWPTGLFLLANEGATTSVEVATNFAKAIGGSIVLYAALGALVFGMRTFARKITSRGAHEV